MTFQGKVKLKSWDCADGNRKEPFGQRFEFGDKRGDQPGLMGKTAKISPHLPTSKSE